MSWPPIRTTLFRQFLIDIMFLYFYEDETNQSSYPKCASIPFFCSI